MHRKNNIRVYEIEYTYNKVITHGDKEYLATVEREKEQIIADSAREAMDKIKVYNGRTYKEGIVGNQIKHTDRNIDIKRVELIASAWLEK